MSGWSVTLTTVLDRPVTEADALQVAEWVAAETCTRLVSVVTRDLTLSVVVQEGGDDLPDATGLFGAYERAVALAGYAVASWEAVELVTDPQASDQPDSNGPSVPRAV